MKKKAGRLFLLFISVLLLVGVSSTPAFSAYLSYMRFTINETDGTDRGSLPLIVENDNDYLRTKKFINSTGNNTFIELDGSGIPYMLSENKTLIVTTLPANGQISPIYYLTYTPEQTYFPIITGVDGYITVSDNDSHEIGNNGTVGQSGWIDTSAGENKYLASKPGAYETHISGADNITSLAASTNRTYGTWELFIDTSSASIRSDNWSQSTNPVTGQPWTWFEVGLIEPGIKLQLDGTDDSEGIESWIEVHYTGGSLNIRPDGEGYQTDIGDETPSGGDHWDIMSDQSDTTWIMPTVNWQQDTYQLGGFDHADLSENITSVDIWIKWRGDYTGFIYTDAYIVYGLREHSSVTATGVSAGSRSVSVSFNSTHQSIWVDGSMEDSASIITSLPNNSSNLTFGRNNVTPYADNFTVSVNGTQQLWFQPNSIIENDTIPNRGAASINGTFVWGSNPSGIDISVGSILPSPTIAGFPEDPTPPDIVSPLPDQDLYDPTLPSSGFPIYGLINPLATVMGVPISLFWALLAVTLSMIAGIEFYKASNGSTGWTAAGVGAVLCVFAIIGNGIIGIWFVMVYGIIAVPVVMLESKFAY